MLLLGAHHHHGIMIMIVLLDHRRSLVIVTGNHGTLEQPLSHFENKLTEPLDCSLDSKNFTGTIAESSLPSH